MENKTYSHPEVGDRRRFLHQMSAGAAGMALYGLYQPESSHANILSRKTSRVSFVTGTDHREVTYQSLKPFEKEIEKAIGDRQVVIKPNVGQIAKEWWLNASDPDQLRGILDFLKPIYDRQVIIAEGTAAAPTPQGFINTFIGYENYGYLPLKKEYNVKFIDLNDHPTIKKFIQAPNRHPMPINLIDIYLDPNVYMISATRLKNSGGVIATLSLKNIAMGSPINHYKQKKAEGRNEKQIMHAWGRRGQSYNIFLLATMGIQPDLAVLDGVVGMEGNGPVRGTPIEHGVALASTDWLAADRLAVELMGHDYSELKYLVWCGEAGMGEDDLSKIKINGPDYKKHIKKYKLPKNIEQQRAWIYEDMEKAEK
ncbi:DUF362 domain-containing protein [Candidatus Latescibacterota bacterium]